MLHRPQKRLNDIITLYGDFMATMATRTDDPKFSLTDRSMIKALRLADRILNALAREMEDEEKANAFFPRHYISNEHNNWFNAYM